MLLVRSIWDRLGLVKEDFAPIEQAMMVERDEEKAIALVDERMLRIGIVGDANDVIARLEPLVAAGARHLSFGPPLGPDPLQGNPAARAGRRALFLVHSSGTALTSSCRNVRVPTRSMRMISRQAGSGHVIRASVSIQIRRMVVPLLGRQQRQRRLQRIDAEVLALRYRYLATAQVKAVAHAHVAGAVALNRLDHNGQIVQFKFVVCLHGQPGK